MFERRLKIFLMIVFGVTLVLLMRVLQVQVVQHAYWSERAKKFLTRPTFVETVRGRILDVKGRELAVDVPCIDAMVAYQAISHQPDGKWMLEQAGLRLARRLGDDYSKATRSRREALRKEELARVKHDLDAMWKMLASCPGMDESKIADIRQSIVRRVENRRRWLWYRSYQNAVEEHTNKKPSSWYSRWLTDDNKPPELDEYNVTVEDEIMPHPVLRAIDAKTVSMLGKEMDRFPGLSMQPSTHRYYPYNAAGAHWIGTVAPVTRKEKDNDPFVDDDLRRYEYNDLIGRSGIEALAEPMLRGSRGMITRAVGSNEILTTQDAKHGKDVTSSVDIDLQQQIEAVFPRVVIKNKDAPPDIHELHGAAVVIDVPTGEVRAMASYPAYNPNELDQTYNQLVQDKLAHPLLNRATMSTLEPGSTVKPVVGLWGIKCGVIGMHDTIECTGYMNINGRPVRWGRCWVASRYEALAKREGWSVGHHPIPFPHPTGFLTFADALERSCNPFYQTIAERLGFERLSEGFRAFGLGQPTGIGIPERAGLLPQVNQRMLNPRGALWSAGIGQGQVAATPLQMANVAATIARGGVWVKPSLLSGFVPPDQLNPPKYATTRPARIDLQIPPEAIAMAQEGMWQVVHSRSGTGNKLNFVEVGVAAKTGTAQASRILIDQLDAAGQPVYKRDEQGNLLMSKDGKPLPEKVPLEVSTKDHVNPLAPWYLGTGADGKDLAHAWFIGFAPRENPKIAFCVFVEYGGSGGVTAASIAHETLAACVEHGYLRRER